MHLPVRFYLLGLKGLTVLEKTISLFGANVIKEIVIGKDQNVKNDYSKEIEELCDKTGITYLYKNHDIEFNNCLSIAIGWRWMIDLSRVPSLIVLHDSILPKYRGFNPLVSALINGETVIGVTALFASDQYDDGDIIFQEKITIGYPIKIARAIELISSCYTNLTCRIIHELVQNRNLPRITQDKNLISYSLWRDESDYRINWEDSSENIKRFVDAVGFPYYGASTITNNQTIRVLEVEEINDVHIENRTPGKTLFLKNNLPVVVCGQGLLMITKMINSEHGYEYFVTSIKTRFL